MSKLDVEEHESDWFEDNYVEASLLLPILKKIFNNRPATCMERLYYAARGKKIKGEKIGKIWFLNSKSVLVWLIKHC